MTEKKRHGLLIDYEYCTGCFTCQVACAQEYRRPKQQVGIQVTETITVKPGEKTYLAYIPFPTENCNLCAARTAAGEQPTCVKHCMANVIQHGTIEELAQRMTKPRMALWTPR
jgi:Fe-S-cluster-containing dehydrogenase component